MSAKKLDALLVANERLKEDLRLSHSIAPTSIACINLVDFVLNTEDPWIKPEFSSIKKQERVILKSRPLSKWFSWRPPSLELKENKSPSNSPPPSPTLSSSPSIGAILPLLHCDLYFQAANHALTRLPPEVIQYVLRYLDPLSLTHFARVSTTCFSNACVFVSTSLDEFRRARFVQHTSIRFDIPPGTNPWKRDRISKERERTDRMQNEMRSKSINLVMMQDRREQEKQVLMPLIAGFRCDELHNVLQSLWQYAQQQLHSPNQPLPATLLNLSANHPLHPLLAWSISRSYMAPAITFLSAPPPAQPPSPPPPPPPYLDLEGEDQENPPAPCDFTFKVEAMHFRVVDASPSMHLYPKILPQFQPCTGVVFCASLDYRRPQDEDLNSQMEEDIKIGPYNKRKAVFVRPPPRCSRPRRVRPAESPLEQSLRHFLHLCLTRCFEDVPILLLFTPSDVFMQDLLTHDLHDVFPSYQGGNDYGRATQYLTHLFHAQNSNSYRKIYTYFMPQNASAETTIIPILFNCVKNIVLERGLRYASIIL